MSALQRERSPGENSSLADDRPFKKARLDASSSNTGEIQTSSGSARNVKKQSKMSKRILRKLVHPEPGTPDDVLWHEIREKIGHSIVEEAVERGVDLESPVKFGDIMEVDVLELSSSGDSIAVLSVPHPPWAIITPFALPGEKIRVKIIRNGRMLSHADLLEIVRPNTSLRDMARVKCKYFGECAGCQYQMLDYSTQLSYKRQVINKAYRFYSNLPTSLIPEPLDTIGSPLQYGYRTKITPHFDAPHKGKKREEWQTWIGFDTKGRRKVLDIEECPIATPILNQSLGPIREEVRENIGEYKRGATLLMRDSLLPVASSDDTEREHVCIRDHKAIVREQVGKYEFEFPANSFFQNNNSILPLLTDYVRDAIFSSTFEDTRKPSHLVDAYCGSGLFAITLSPFFNHVVGIEISEESIRYARHNVKLNRLSEEKCVFRAGQAEKIFEVVQEFPADDTVMVIDPPRKGCDDAFISQLLRFGARTVVYVSCNVHTQARDVGKIINSETGYVLESIRGFDLFPQTAHVESVAVLRRK
ncbi:S-adenosyl-L-methionine-dependent methyltransferase [Serendipita vermifera]|nr:S-adenosyl-L-methionine-dependent methyltransferase [Serendipita vermifera]